jgi:hypothetical protein
MVSFIEGRNASQKELLKNVWKEPEIIRQLYLCVLICILNKGVCLLSERGVSINLGCKAGIKFVIDILDSKIHKA